MDHALRDVGLVAQGATAATIPFWPQDPAGEAGALAGVPAVTRQRCDGVQPGKAMGP